MKEAVKHYEAALKAAFPNGATGAVVFYHWNEARKALEQPAQQESLTADDLREPKNGTQWRVEWWNESCRMMLPSDAKLDGFTSYKNGTMQFTIKKAAHGIKEQP